MRLTYETLALDRPEPHILRVTLNRPDAANALNTQMGRDLHDFFEQFQLDTHDLRVIIVTGAGEKAFCAGGDLKERKGMTDAQWQAQHAVFERMAPLETKGIVGRLLGFDVVVNKYMDTPSQITAGDAGTTSLYPAYFADWSRFHTIVDRLNMVMRRFDQTLPGYVTFFGEKRLATSVRDPFSGVRYRSTGTAA